MQQRIAASLVDLSSELRAKYSPQHVRCAHSEPINVAYVAAMTTALRLPDPQLAMRLLLGAKVAGDLPPTKAWDARFKPGSLGMQFEDLPHGQWNEWLHGDIERRATSSSQAKETAEIICTGSFRHSTCFLRSIQRRRATAACSEAAGPRITRQPPRIFHYFRSKCMRTLESGERGTLPRDGFTRALLVFCQDASCTLFSRERGAHTPSSTPPIPVSLLLKITERMALLALHS